MAERKYQFERLTPIDNMDYRTARTREVKTCSLLQACISQNQRLRKADCPSPYHDFAFGIDIKPCVIEITIGKTDSIKETYGNKCS